MKKPTEEDDHKKNKQQIKSTETFEFLADSQPRQ